MGAITEIRMIGIDELLRSLRAVRSGIQRGSSIRVGSRLGREGLRIVKQLTPRQRHRGRLPGSRRGHPPFWKQWELIEETSRGIAYRGTIRSPATREGRSGTSWGRIALASVEFGAQSHPISARGKYPLKWREAGRQRRFARRISEAFRGGEIRDVFQRQDPRGLVRVWPAAQPVDHPGHKGFGMVQETREHLERVSQTILTQFATEIANNFRGFTLSVS